MTTAPRVPYDPELVDGLAAFLERVEIVPLRADTILANRAHFATLVPPIEQLVDGHAVEFEHRDVPGPAGEPDVTVTVLRPAGGTDGHAPGVYHIHGGGMVLGNRFFGVESLVRLVEELGAVAVTVEYRLAPEHPHPAPVEDCYAGLAWMAGAAAELGVDPARILLMGMSAGGGLSAATALLARDRGGPQPAGQLLGCPMLDDRNDTTSSRQYDGIGAWDRNNNHTGWTALLGGRRGGPDVPPYAAPARAADLSGLPPAFIEVGAAEVFRDEAARYAQRIWDVGGQAELHIWSGGYHGFAGFSPEASVSRSANAVRDNWIGRILTR